MTTSATQQTQDPSTSPTGQEVTPPQEGDKGALEDAGEKKFTQADVDAAVNANATQAGRTNKELEDRAKALKTGEEALATNTTKAQQDRDEAEKLAVKDNPDALASLATVQAQRKTREENEAEKLRLEQLGSSLTERETALAGSATERLAQAIGAEAKVDPKLILQYLPKGTEAEMKELAGRLPEADPAASTTASPTPDSGVTTGLPAVVQTTGRDKMKAGFDELDQARK